MNENKVSHALFTVFDDGLFEEEIEQKGTSSQFHSAFTLRLLQFHCGEMNFPSLV
jgi:hypothetical protein